MNALILDMVSENIEILTSILNATIADVSVFSYASPFAFVTGIYDELKGDADIAFIHIGREEKEHISMARDVQNYFPQLKLIFYSEDNVSASEIFEARPSYYMQLPWNDEAKKQLADAISRMCEDISNADEDCLKIANRGVTLKIAIDSIEYIESVGRKILIYTAKDDYETYSTMTEMLEKLNDKFIQCHRSYIVNLSKVESIIKDSIVLKSGRSIPVSRNLKSSIKECLEKNVK